MASLFTDLLRQITKRNNSGELSMAKMKQHEAFIWYLDRARKIRSGIRIETGTKVLTENVIRQHPSQQDPDLRFQIGAMILYKYDPKYKFTLPYYDLYPVVFPIKMYGDGFLGINMHYLPIWYRAALMDALYETLQPADDENPQDVLRITYEILKTASQFSYFVPCVKRYLTEHIRSNVIVIPLIEWEAALFLPLASWVKENEERVWRDSIERINRG